MIPVVVAKKARSNSKVVESLRKCPFCGTANPVERKKCRNCGHAYPFPLQKDKYGTNKHFYLNMSDPRTSSQKTLEVAIKVLPGLFFLFPMLQEHLKSDIWMYIVIGFTVFLVMGAMYAIRSLNIHVEKICQNCGRTMVIRIPFNRNQFPSAVSCWNCGAVHDIGWTSDNVIVVK